MLGGHTSTVRSALVYSRDSLGRPLRMLERLLREVRLGSFIPDATRSGRFPGGRTVFSSGDMDNVSHFSYEPSLADDLGDTSELGPTVEPAALDGSLQDVAKPAAVQCKVEASEMSWSLVSDNGVIEIDASSDSDTDVVDTTSSSSDEEGAANSTARRPVRKPRVPDELKLIQHRKFKTLHLMEKQNERIMLCGRVAEPARYEPLQETRFDTPCCHTCWRKIDEYH